MQKQTSIRSIISERAHFSGTMLNDADLHAYGNSPEKVLLTLYRKFNTSGFSKISGPFTACIELPGKGLLLVRDPLGQKQLYYTVKDDIVRFSGTPADLIEPWMHDDMQAISDYLALGYIPSPRTAKKEIRSIKAGHCVLIGCDGSVREEQYFSPQFYPKTELSYKEACKETEFLLKQSLKRCLAKCNTPGVLLSGGIDSNLVLCCSASLLDTAPDSFTLYFSDEAYDESGIASMAAEAVHSTHHKIKAVPENFHRFSEILSKSGQPFADSSLLASTSVMEFASKDKKTLLTGDGGDELFGGYKRYRFMAIRDALGSTLTKAGRPFAKFLLAMLPGAEERRTKLSTLRRTCEAFTMEQIPCYASFQEIFNTGQISMLCPSLPCPSYQKDWERIAAAFGSDDQSEMCNGIDLCTYLPEDGSRKDCIAATLSGVTALSPLLDIDLATFAFSLPRKYKTDMFTAKKPLRTLGEKMLPPILMKQPKRGFGIPLARWFRNELRDIALQLPDSLPEYFDSKMVRCMVNAHLENKIDNGSKIWALYALANWNKIS